MATTVTGDVSRTTDARSLRRKAERTRALERSVIHVILLVGSISMLFPLYWMISTLSQAPARGIPPSPHVVPQRLPVDPLPPGLCRLLQLCPIRHQYDDHHPRRPGGPAVERVTRSLRLRPHPLHRARCHLHPRAEHNDGPRAGPPSSRSTSSSKILDG